MGNVCPENNATEIVSPNGAFGQSDAMVMRVNQTMSQDRQSLAPAKYQNSPSNQGTCLM